MRARGQTSKCFLNAFKLPRFLTKAILAVYFEQVGPPKPIKLWFSRIVVQILHDSLENLDF